MTKLAIPYDSKMFHQDFIFGVATSSYQIEGDRASRLDSIWDIFCQQENTISDQTNGDVACDHINRWQEDVNLICDLGVDAYRFSISWPRVMQENGQVNETGLAFYELLIDTLKMQGKKVFVTLYHWDMPKWILNEFDGFSDEKIVFNASSPISIRARSTSSVYPSSPK